MVFPKSHSYPMAQLGSDQDLLTQFNLCLFYRTQREHRCFNFFEGYICSLWMGEISTISRIGVWRRAEEGVPSPANTAKADSCSDKEGQTLSSGGPTVGPIQHPEVRALHKKITPLIGGRARHSSQSSELPWINSFHPSNPVREAQY